MHRNNRCGFVMADVLTGIALLVVLSGAMIVAQSARSHAAQKFADTRAAVRLAERALIELQNGRPLPTDAPDAKLEVAPLAAEAGVAGRKWIEVRATLRSQKAVLCGLVPASVLNEVRP